MYTHKKNRGGGGVPAASAILKSHKRRRDQPFLGTGAKVGVPWLPNAARPRCPSLDRSSMETEYEEVALCQSSCSCCGVCVFVVVIMVVVVVVVFLYLFISESYYQIVNHGVRFAVSETL